MEKWSKARKRALNICFNKDVVLIFFGGDLLVRVHDRNQLKFGDKNGKLGVKMILEVQGNPWGCKELAKIRHSNERRGQ